MHNDGMPHSPIQIAKDLTGKNADEIAEEMGISSSYMSRLSSGDRKLTLAHVEKLAKIANVSLDKFYRMMGGANENNSSDQESLEQKEKRERIASMLDFDPTEQVNYDTETFRLAYSTVYAIHIQRYGKIGDVNAFADMVLDAYDIMTGDSKATEK
jgi:transcriptional regulator with XRE-family HTH domain